MRALPPNISAHRNGFNVRVRRKGMRYQAFVACRPSASAEERAQAIARAEALRDRFIALHGAVAEPWSQSPSQNSNTGIAGISESINWWRSKPKHCFAVSYPDGPAGARRMRTKRFYYGDFRPREVALRKAIALRSQKVGLSCCSALTEPLNSQLP